MKAFSDWSVRTKLLVPSIIVILIGGLVLTQTFFQLTSSVRDETLQHVIEIGDLRVAVLDLTAEYRKGILADEDRDSSEKIKKAKKTVLTNLELLQIHQDDHTSAAEADFGGLKNRVHALFMAGDDALANQKQIAIALETLEELEKKSSVFFQRVNKQIEEEAAVDRSTGHLGAQIPESLLELETLNKINISIVSMVSETREYVLSGEDDTLAERRLIEETLVSDISGLTRFTQQHPLHKPLIDDLKQNQELLLKNSDDLVALTQQKIKNIAYTEDVANELQTRFASLVDSEVRTLDSIFENKNLIFLITSTAMLLLVILALTISSNRIRMTLEHFDLATRKLKQGFHDVNVVVRGKDEFGQLADTFNDMAKDLRESIAFREIAEAKLKTLNADLEKRVEERTAELKEARDNAEAANQLKSHLVTTMSHELRTPLTSIIGSLGMLSGTNKITDADVIANLLELANRNSQQLARLVDDILDVDKLDASAIEFELQKLELSALVCNAVDLNVGYANEKSVDLVTGVLLPGVQVVGDEMRLMQVMANLISNATKFSPEGGTVGISMAKGDGEVTVSVTDEGPGVPDDIRSTIFDRFVRGENTDSRNKGGAGLGLNISKTLVEKQGGTIGYVSDPGQPTTFYFTLPLAA